MEELKKFVDSVTEMDASPRHQGSQSSNGSLGRMSVISNGILNCSLVSQAAMSQRIVNVEYYMSPPVKEFDNLHSEFRNSAVKKVPVIRIFGTTPAGQKICANIHGVYPYISILDDEAVEGFEYRIATALDNAINDSVTSSKFGKGGQKGKNSTQHVFKVIRIVGKTFYGFRSCSEVFLRIFFYSPLILKKAVDLLQSGNILGRRFQPYEAHIPYSLQFMIDYCLYGMNYIHYTAVKFRRSSRDCATTHSEDIRSLSQSSNSSIPGYIDPACIQESLLGPAQLSKLTLCELEIDVLASDIILESKLSEKAMSVNPGIDSIWKDEIERRRLQEVENCSQITIPESQERSQAPSMHPTEEKYMQVLLGKLTSFFENSNVDENTLDETRNLPFLNNSYMDDSVIIPSSQVLDHLSGEDPPNDAVINNQLSQEDDEFIKLLENMAEEPVSENKDNEILEDPFRSGMDENQEIEDSLDDDANAEENVWDDSFLNSSILEKISDAESAHQDSVPGKDENPATVSRMIFQCDGQGGGDSDSSSEDNASLDKQKKKQKRTANTRLTRRMSEIKISSKEKASKCTSKAHDTSFESTSKRTGRHSVVQPKNSPAFVNRLSLTFRRKSKSQDSFMHASHNGDDLIAPTPEPVKYKRRSRSMSAGKKYKECAAKQNNEVQAMVSEKANERKIGNVATSKRVTRKSLSAPPINHVEKKNLISSKASISDRNSLKGKIKKVCDVSVTPSQSKILEQQPVICLTKIDAESSRSSIDASESKKILSKRVRRKPRRFLDEGAEVSLRFGNVSDSSRQHERAHEEQDSEKMSERMEVKEVKVLQLPRTKLNKLETKKDKTMSKDEADAPNSPEPDSGNSKGGDFDSPKISRKEAKRKQKRKLKKQLTIIASSSTSSVSKKQSKGGDHDATTSNDSSSRKTNDKPMTPVKEKILRNGARSTDILSNEANDKQRVIDEEKLPKLRNGVQKLGVVKSKKKVRSKTMIRSDCDNVVGNDDSEETCSGKDLKDIHTRNNLKSVQVEKIFQHTSPSMIQPTDEQQMSIKGASEYGVKKCSGVSGYSHETLNGNATIPKKKKRLGLKISKQFKITTAVSPVPNSLPVKKLIAVAPVAENVRIASPVKEALTGSLSMDYDSNKVRPEEKKQFSDFGITCKPDNKSAMSQTNPTPMTRDFSVSAQPMMKDKSSGSQQGYSVTTCETQTDQKEMVSIETQTDAIVELCLCQCTCVTKEKTDTSTDIQDDLKPVMESKRIQVDNVDMITRARSARFTTPQGNKIRRVNTPSRSPEKRKSFPDSPSGRRHTMSTTPTHSRYLSALVLKTPTSHHKYRSYNRGSPSTPTESLNDQHEAHNATPPGSREEYLINCIRATSNSPRKRHFKPRNLDIESKMEPVQNVTATPVSTPQETETVPLSIEDEMHEAMESCECEDLSVNSIYEYEEEPTPETSTPTPTLTLPSEDNEEYSPASLTSFQKKRILSKHRTKNRLDKKKAANLDANRGIPDVFQFEYEPLKQPASYKSTIKWLEAEKHRICFPKGSPDGTRKHLALDEELSDEESLPPPVKLFGGGNMSDDEDSDSDEHPRSSISADINTNIIKPFTPPVVDFSTPSTHQSTHDRSVCYSGSGTPRSILRQNGSSRRLTGNILKRKIRWEDDEFCKRIKMEGDSIMVKVEDQDERQSLLTNRSLNRTADTSELDGPSFKNALGLENSMSNFQDVKALHQCQFLTTMCVEIHCDSRNELLPDPAIDRILAIFVLITNDYPDSFKKPREFLHLLVLDEKSDEQLSSRNEFNPSQSTRAYASEENLIEGFIALVRFWDPDILVGYEIEKSSFGYLIQRRLWMGKDLTQELSRVLPIVKKDGQKDVPFRGKDEWNGTIGGRIVLNLWRLLRHEITVQSYTFENAAYHILLRRVCKFSQKTLNAYWSHKMHRYKVIQYFTVRVKGAVQIMDKLDLINRTSELARLFGIQFYEVLSRGSQFRVESMMLRATKPLDFIAPSPTVAQRAKMRAPEYLPLILEPRSNYYTDPVAVLDFQSLYPSMMIAYNYDYASLLGRVEHLGLLESFPLGCLENAVSPAELLRLRDHIHISPAGVAFLDKSIIKGVVPEMLEQILDTRQMVKRAMKKWKKEGASLQKVLDSRQLGLKLIANVTYGYTSANFSGRMPCVEIADSIVSKGRETLQRAIDHVKENFHRWGAEVVYGDTDSMFVLFRGKSRDEAFKLAYEIADEVTQANPKPVKLKFEKIYQPCILQSKKRYVGYSYETPDQSKPTYDAKGIETVRRDGCPAIKKILEKALHVLFTLNKRENVEAYVKSQFVKLFKGRVSMQDYIFAKEYRGREGYKPTASVPSLAIAKKSVEIDPRAEPLVSERVPYVVIYGDPRLPLIKLVRTPDEYLKNPTLRLNAHYYIEKAIIPALNRCLSHAGMNVTKWYLQLPRKYLRNVLDQKSKGQGTLDGYVLHQNCLRCDGKAERGLCNNCLNDETQSVIYLQEVLRNAKSKLNTCVEICTNCAGETDRCVSIDCPILHKLARYQRDQAYMKNVERELVKLEW